jgi:hypothetical protein
MSRDSLLEPLSSSTAILGTCKDCRFYCAKEQECRANPPQAFPMPGKSSLTGEPRLNIVGIWPSARPELWCGAFKERAQG